MNIIRNYSRHFIDEKANNGSSKSTRSESQNNGGAKKGSKSKSETTRLLGKKIELDKTTQSFNITTMDSKEHMDAKGRTEDGRDEAIVSR